MFDLFRPRRSVCTALVAASTLLLLSGAWSGANAQAVKGALLGNITDDGGLALPGVTVTITEQNTNITYSTAANESGYYIFSNLKDGTYRVESELSGFKKTVRENIRIDVNQTVRVDLKMEVGALQETITVVGETPALQTDRADTGRIIPSVQLQQVPLGFNRNFQGMLLTVPGATRPFRPHSEFFNAQDSLSTNVNGQSRLANNVQIEGVDDNHRTGLLTTLIPSAEAIETVNISTSNYDAEFGRAGGAITNVTLRSGTNDLKGSVFVFGNNEKTSSPGYFSHTNPPTKYLQSGFTLGGPIRRNRLFYFGDYQHTLDDAGRTQRATIPTEVFRNGDFSAAPTIIYNPFTGNADGTGRQPFAENRIPEELISPIAKSILANVPAPNIAGALGQTNFQQDYVRHKVTDSFDAKVNYQITSKDQLSGRLSFMRPEITDPPIFGIYGGGGKDFSGVGVDNTYSTGLNYTRTWSNTLVMEVRGGMNYYHNEALSAGAGLTTSTDLGIRNANLDEWTSGITSMDIGGFSSPLVGFAASLPWDRSERTVQFATIFTKLAGNHTIKFGEDMRHNRDFLLQTQDNGGPRGQFQFRGSQTATPSDTLAQAGFANAFAAFLLDWPSRVNRDLKVVDPGVRQNAFFTFIQDKWAVSKQLTIDLGLRHEYYTPFIGLVDQGGLSNYDPATNTLQVAGFTNVSKSVGVKSYWKNFAPRAGLSLRLDDKTVVRAGYGVSTIPFPDNSYAYNFPVKQNNQFNPPNGFARAGSMAEGFPDPIVADVPSTGIIDAGTPALRNQSYFNVPSSLHEGSLHSWNVAYQRQLSANWTAEAAYVGNRGHDIPVQYNLNAGLVLGADNAGRPLFAPFGKTADVTSWIPLKTEFHSLQVKIDRRFANGILFTNSYTLGRGKSFNTGDSNSGIPTPADLDRSWARTDQDRLHNFVSSFLYQLPFGPDRRWVKTGALSQILGGWQVSGFFTAMSGLPINFTASATNLRAPGNTQRPDATGKPEVFGNVGPDVLWFDTSVFSAPAPNTWGNVQRNALLDGPSLVNLDATIAKLFALPRGARGEFRVDIFNLTNTPHFARPGGGFGSSTFGRITATEGGADMRSMRFGLKVTF
jgi:Carboxypeptidase regulatory-like domain/TonB dependent receptor-like, beta-barrel